LSTQEVSFAFLDECIQTVVDGGVTSNKINCQTCCILSVDEKSKAFRDIVSLKFVSD